MLDRMREALFSTLAPWLADALVLDLFAGSGSLGLEALSRGARRARFVERDLAVVRLIEENARLLGEEERAEVVRGDALDPASWGSGAPDVVFFDPPYPMLDRRATRTRLMEAIRALVREHAAAEAVLVFHAPRGRILASELKGDLEARSRDYGSGTLWYVQAAGDSP